MYQKVVNRVQVGTILGKDNESKFPIIQQGLWSARGLSGLSPIRFQRKPQLKDVVDLLSKTAR